MGIDLEYVLVTPARNEEKDIEKTILSVVSQTKQPKRWVIVSDGSTDRTDEIVESYRKTYRWIELIRMPEHRDRQFAAKVGSFNAGYKRLEALSYDIIGNIDGDVSFDAEFFEFLLSKFAQMPNLGVAGTPFVEDGMLSYDSGVSNKSHVSGACQIFRRECFEEVGGYLPIKGGGIDWAAVTTARMKGWKTQTFDQKQFYHHRKMGTGNGGYWGARFRHGQKDYYLGGHPLWQLFRAFYQMTKKPYLVGGILLLSGYVYAFLKRTKRPLPSELIRFHRSEQMQRLRSIITISKKNKGVLVSSPKNTNLTRGLEGTRE